MTDAEMLELLKDVKGHFGAVPDLWKLDNTTTKDKELWWPGNKCVRCGQRAVRYDSVNGYLCEDEKT